MSPAIDFAATIIARLGLSASDRMILGAALVCDAASDLKASPPPGMSPIFANIEVDESEPFKTAISALTVLDNQPLPTNPAAIAAQTVKEM